MTLTLEYSYILQNYKLGNLNASARALIIHLSVSNDKMFPLVPTFFYPVTLTLEFGLLFEKFNLANNFSTVNASVMIFKMNIPCD